MTLGAAVVQAEVGGYLKQFGAVADQADSGRPLDGAMSTRLRLHGFWRVSSSVSTAAAYGVSPRVQAATSSNDFAAEHGGAATYRVADARVRLYPGQASEPGEFSITQNIDRGWVEWSVGAADLTVGRQTIAFGSGRFVNPTDVLAPFSYTALDKEERVGIDAVRARYALGAFSELDVGAVFGADFRADDSAYYLRAKTYARGVDASILALRFRRHALAGLDITRSIGSAGTWLELAYASPAADAEDYTRLAAGADYSPAPGVYVFGEYHLNTAGAGDTDAYASLSATPAYVDGAAYLLGRHYVGAGVSAEAGPLAVAGAQVVVNLVDGSALLAPALEFSFAEDVYLSGGAFVSILTGTDTATPREFAAYPDTLHGAIRLYF